MCAPLCECSPSVVGRGFLCDSKLFRVRCVWIFPLCLLSFGIEVCIGLCVLLPGLTRLKFACSILGEEQLGKERDGRG